MNEQKRYRHFGVGGITASSPKSIERLRSRSMLAANPFPAPSFPLVRRNGG